VKETIKYHDGYKYQLHEEYTTKIIIHPDEDLFDHGFITLKKDGTLIIKEGYAWDGPSGPTIDSKNFMRGSLVHDALYQLMRQGQLPEHMRPLADEILDTICKEDGMSAIRRWWVAHALFDFGGAAAKRRQETILTAP
jgi:hypothetical protein